MIIQTKDLTGVALDWAVAKSVGAYKGLVKPYKNSDTEESALIFPNAGHCEWMQGEYHPSTDWAQGGPLIDQYKIDLYWHHEYQLDDETRPMWEACCENAQVVFADDYDPIGETALIAACRAIVAAELGDSVDVPDELIGAAS